MPNEKRYRGRGWHPHRPLSLVPGTNQSTRETLPVVLTTLSNQAEALRRLSLLRIQILMDS